MLEVESTVFIMKKIIGLVLLMILLVLGVFVFSRYFFNHKQNIIKRNLLIQMPLDLQGIKDLPNTLNPVVNKIIQEELGIEYDKNFPIFFFKKRQAITVYYVTDIYDNGEKFLFSQLDALQIKSLPKNVTMQSEVDFFGDKKAPVVDLVAFIDDPDAELSLLNKEMKKAAHSANEKYKHSYNLDLYDVAKSERFSFKPHLSLGHLRVGLIKEIINDTLKANNAIERIKQRIMKVVSKALSELTLDSRKIFFHRFVIYDLKKREYIKEYKFSSLNVV